MARVLCLVAPGFEELELVAPVDVLRRAGVEVVLASVGDSLSVPGRNGITLCADVGMDDLSAADFEMLLIPGGPGVAEMRKDPEITALVAQFARAGKDIAAICAAPLLLADEGLLEGKRFTAHDSTGLSGALGNERVVQDGKLITSRGAGTALDFGLALVERLCGQEKTESIKRSIMM